MDCEPTNQETEEENELQKSIYLTACAEWQEYIKELFNYDPNTGMLTWKIAKSNRIVGTKAGYLFNGYIYVKIDSASYPVHKVIWLWVYGEWTRVDHKDRDRSNNRLLNLRPATVSQNAANRLVATNNLLGIKGVRCRNGRWGKRYEARIRVVGKLINLGRFDTAEEAAIAYDQAAIKYYGEFAVSQNKRSGPSSLL